MEYSTLLFHEQDDIANISFHRPNAANSINLQMARDLRQVLLNCDERPEIKVIVIDGFGEVFCPGGDLKSFVKSENPLSYHLKELLMHLNTSISCLNRTKKIVIASVNGVAAGSGMSIVCASDIVLASESSRFTTAYTKAGLTPDASLSYFLPRIVGSRRALELTVTNRSLSAQEAYDWGIVNRVVPKEELAEETEKYAKQIASGATTSFGATKRLLSSAWHTSLESQMELETIVIAEISRNKESQEGIQAFIEKRPPIFN